MEDLFLRADGFAAEPWYNEFRFFYLLAYVNHFRNTEKRSKQLLCKWAILRPKNHIKIIFIWLDKREVVLKMKCSEAGLLIGFGFIYLAACISDAGGEWTEFLPYIYKGFVFLGIFILSHIRISPPFRGWLKVVRTL